MKKWHLLVSTAGWRGYGIFESGQLIKCSVLSGETISAATKSKEGGNTTMTTGKLGKRPQLP